MNLKFDWKHPFLRSPEFQKNPYKMCVDIAGEKTTYLQQTYQLGINEREGYFSNLKINLLFGRKVRNMALTTSHQ